VTVSPRLKLFVSVLLFAAFLFLVTAFLDHAHRGKWLSSAGLAFDIAGISQLDIVGFMDRLIERYSDSQRYPKGPPGHITRRLVADRGSPLYNWINWLLFYNRLTGFYMLVLGFFLQLLGTWL
jgi:hypothetical protein